MREIDRLRIENKCLKAALEAMLNAYAPRADWAKPEELHSAVLTAGLVLNKAQGGE